MPYNTDNLFKDLQHYLDEHHIDENSGQSIEQVVEQFMSQYNASPRTPITPETAQTADDFMELAYEADDAAAAMKYARKALKLDPEFLDAETMIAQIGASSVEDLTRKLKRVVDHGEKQMREQRYFEEENIGDFWLIFQTRPYMRVRMEYFKALISCDKLRAAIREGEEMLQLCTNDNLGVRYSLMAIYATLEEEEKAAALFKQFEDTDDPMLLLPLSVLYYRVENNRKAANYLRKLVRANKDTRRFLTAFLNGTIEQELKKRGMSDGYRPGTMEELLTLMQDSPYLFFHMEAYFEWAVAELRKK